MVVVVVEGRLEESHGRRRPIEEEGRIVWKGGSGSRGVVPRRSWAGLARLMSDGLEKAHY